MEILTADHLECASKSKLLFLELLRAIPNENKLYYAAGEYFPYFPAKVF
jgi:hypothetical protein